MKTSISSWEYQQLEQIPPKEIKTRFSFSTLWSRLENIWKFLLRYLTESPQLRVWYTCDQEGKIWWSAYDPKTKSSIYQISEEQMRIWIEQLHR